MKKQARLHLIEQLLTEREFSRQQDLQAVLEKEGVQVTQATLSRDMRELGVERKMTDHGRSYYRLPQTGSQIPLRDLAHYVQKIDRVEFNLVIHTGLGEADVLASSLDTSGDPRILGTIAGADTLLIVARSSQDGAQLEREIQNYLEEEE